jgi:hypothetical protein
MKCYLHKVMMYQYDSHEISTNINYDYFLSENLWST